LPPYSVLAKELMFGNKPRFLRKNSRIEGTSRPAAHSAHGFSAAYRRRTSMTSFADAGDEMNKLRLWFCCSPRLHTCWLRLHSPERHLR
jgi:hypothetical protein